MLRCVCCKRRDLAGRSGHASPRRGVQGFSQFFTNQLTYQPACDRMRVASVSRPAFYCSYSCETTCARPAQAKLFFWLFWTRAE
ncbi:hypothetical protein BJV77DRAFT_761211 [Russula vinacea]|nr:hypothetical protein BJV77DRAFT_761211 [Russula vinacea]